MSDRFLLDYLEYEPYFMDTEQEFVDDEYFELNGYYTMSDEQILGLLNEYDDLSDECEKLENINRGYELENIRLHHLANRMSGALRRIGVYDCYDDDQVESVRNKLSEYDDYMEKVHNTLKMSYKWYKLTGDDASANVIKTCAVLLGVFM